MRQKDIPRQIVIRDSVWQIRFKRDLGRHGNKTIWGLCVFDDKMIYLRQKQTAEELADSYFHELFHAIEHEYNFDLEHRHVWKLGEAMAQITLDNFL